jgi:hypothetical protein
VRNDKIRIIIAKVSKKENMLFEVKRVKTSVGTFSLRISHVIKMSVKLTSINNSLTATCSVRRGIKQHIGLDVNKVLSSFAICWNYL